MIELYTSRWANKELAELGCVPVDISRGVPRFRTPYRYRLVRELAPDDAAWAREDEEGFAASYRRQLEGIGLDAIIARLARISGEHGGQPPVLLCYEREDQFCHRHVLRRWLRGHGVEITELQPGDLRQREDAADLRVFGEYGGERT